LDNLGVVQHHDSITGTATNYVSNDYYAKAVEASQLTTNMLFEVMKPETLKQFGLDLKRISESLMTREVNMGKKDDNGNEAVKAYSPFMLSKQMVVVV